MKSSVQMLDGVLPVDRLDRQERPEDALLVGTVELLAVGESCKL